MFSSLNLESERDDFHICKMFAPIYFLGKVCPILSVETNTLKIHQGEIVTLKTSTEGFRFDVVAFQLTAGTTFELSLDDNVYPSTPYLNKSTRDIPAILKLGLSA